MLIAYWIVAGLLAAAFLAAGAPKLFTAKKDLAAKGMDWVELTNEAGVKTVGLLEVLGAIGLIVPPLVGVAPILAPLAAVGLGLLMVVATVVHIRRSEPPVPTLVLTAVSAAAAWLGFIVWA